jgi:hypothetical protein
MAIQKTLIKNDRMKAVVHLVATAAGDTTSIALTEFLAADETSSGALTVNIATAHCNCNTAQTGVTVQRGSGGLIALDMHGVSDFPSSNNYPALAIGNTSSINVTFQVPGMLILDVRKIAGYVSPNTNVGV